MTTDMAYSARSFLLRLALATAIVVFFAVLSRAGGPKRVAGGSYFDPTVNGQPLSWPQGLVTYFTDQGDLSPILPNASANTLVASAFSQWTSVPTAALAANNGGQLAEDVNGSNVIINFDNTISLPNDIQSSATATPIGVVYDSDGSVTSALIGAGAGNSSQCFTNAVFGGDDNFGPLATYQHALIVINGQCVQQSSQVVDVQYRLVRVIGSVLGLGWAQLNVNVLTGTPAPTSDDYLGFPLMHYKDARVCVPVTLCYPNPLQLAPDDVAAISRLYPVTELNQSTFAGKQIFATNTARIHGSVRFTDQHGNPAQPMQGVNVIARWIDPQSNQPSRRYALSSVSGFLFTGNAGNPVTGFDDPLGNPFSEWGSTNPAFEGFFDLGGLPLPNGSTAQYQLSVEPINAGWSTGVGPYPPFLVNPSGLFSPIVVTVAAGQDVQQDILMTATAQPIAAPATTWTTPASLPPGGDWMGSLDTYGETQYFVLPAKGNHTLSVAVTALDESGNISESKLQPVIGMWSASDPEGTVPPGLTPSSFNTPVFGLSRLDVQTAATGNFLIGISDLRGDGRPDYHYHARVLYADSVTPTRLGVGGGILTLRGAGLASGLNASVGGVAATILSISAGQMILAAPAFADGEQSVSIVDPASGASSTIGNALLYGADATDNIYLRSANNPPTPVGTQAPTPMRVQVLAADGITPVAGATIAFSATSGVQLSACSATSSCSVATDQGGIAASWLTPAAAGTSTITATLAPAAYSSAKAVSTNLSATQSASDIGVLNPLMYLAQGATVTTSLTARVMSNGAPQNNVKVNFKIVTGAGTLSAPSAQTNSSGYASVNLSVNQIASIVQVTACVAPANAPCQTFYANSVPLSSLNLQTVSGTGQVSTGAAFQPLVVRVVDSSSPPNGVLGALVSFQTTVLRPGGASSGGGNGELNPSNPAMPVILAASQSTVLSDVNGLASVQPSAGGFSAPVEVDIQARAGTSTQMNYVFQLLPAPISNRNSSNNNPAHQPVVRTRRPVDVDGMSFR